MFRLESYLLFLLPWLRRIRYNSQTGTYLTDPRQEHGVISNISCMSVRRMTGGDEMEFVQPIRERKKIEAMKKLLRGSNLRDYCLFVVGINSALRISDLLRLTVGDVSMNGKVKDRIELREKKTGKSKTFPLSDNAQKALHEYLQSRLDKHKPAAPLFPSRKGGGTQPLQRAQAWQIINSAARSVGITGSIGTHTLRKTFAYHAYQMGKDITLLQQLLNHHSPATTLRYIGITQDDMDSVYLTINL